MNGKKWLSWLISFIFLLAIFIPYNKSFAEKNDSNKMNSITLKEAPYSTGDGWTIDSTYSSNPPYAMTKGKNEYLAVGPYGAIMKSKDGRDWRALSRFGNYHLTAIAWDGSKYVLFGANTQFDMDTYRTPSESFISTDGLTWKRIDFSPGESIQQVVGGDHGFVAQGTEHAYFSKDGENWTVIHTFKNKYGWVWVDFENGTYFVISDDDKIMLTSKDGNTWKKNTWDPSKNIHDFIWVKDHYLGVGNGIYTSSDGVSWKKQQQSPSGVTLRIVVSNGSSFMAVGYSSVSDGIYKNVSYTSNNGTVWKRHDLPKLDTTVYTLYPVQGGFAGIGSNTAGNYTDGTYSFFTKDGVEWSYRLVGTVYNVELGGIATNGKRSVAVGLDGTAIYTDDGVKWTSSNPFAMEGRKWRKNLYDVAWGAGRFVAVGHYGAYVSTDAVNWKKVNIPSMRKDGQLRNILWTGKFFVATDQTTGTFTSKDGLTWTHIKGLDDYWLTSMIWDGKQVVGTFQVHNNGNSYTKIMKSTNGTKWTTVQSIKLSDAWMTYTGGRYVAVSRYNLSNAWVSKDGTKWLQVKTNIGEANIELLTTFDGYFYAFNDSFKEINGEYVPYNAYYVSKDGVKWKEVAIPIENSNFDTNGTKRMLDGIKAYGKYIFVGENSVIKYASRLVKP
ncbi:hypothetical protein ACFSO7_02525 [Bacillus sp. CGMCC 1.16607]|uniref:sialidase family protein n=1 Tax=Bacillus sp. CGMCC 1.16607 TaxID=3351842 RepID=UPI00363ED4FD